MEATEIKLVLKDILEKVQRKKKYDMSQLTDDAGIRSTLELDSIDTMDMVWEIEERFGITIDESRLTSLQTIGDVVKTIQDLVANKPKAAANAGA